MNLFEAIFLGIIQGLSEFLPISSTAHLTLTGKLLMNDMIKNHPERWTAFMAVIQLGTLLAVLIYFYKDIYIIVKDFLSENLVARIKISEQSQSSRLGWLIIAGSIPIGVIGLSFKDAIEGDFTKNLYVISCSLIVLGILLAIAEKISSFKKDMDNLTWKDSVIIGLAQSLALIPGSSRSGTSITAGLFLGFNRETAARFSFLLSIPAVFASGLLELKKSLQWLDSSMTINLIVSTLASFIVGYIAIDFLLKYLRKNSTFIFVYYRIALGILILCLIGFGVISM
ncbi:MAG: undecaprenyl-diphosphatase UppP [Syntrophothermus sp.]